MRQIYSRSFTVVWITGDSGYVFSEKIDPGYILHVHSCFAYSPLRDANDNIVVGLRNGGQDMILMAQATAAAQKGSAVGTDFFVGEGDQVFAYFPDAEYNDTIGIHINGVLIPLSEWVKEAE
jgi:hypothetical protein